MPQATIRSPRSAPDWLAASALVRDTASSPRESHSGIGLALIDEFPLRRASTLNLVRRHLREGARPFSSVAEFLTQVASNPKEPCCVMICVGRHSVTAEPWSEQLRRLCHALASTPVIILSDLEDIEEVLAAFRVGASGYIPTNLVPSLVLEALRIVLVGGSFFPVEALLRSRRRAPRASEQLGGLGRVVAEHRAQWPPRQLAVLNLLAQGKANKEIARALEMEESTVKVHMRHIMRKLGASNRTQAALHARRLGITDVLDGVHASIVSAQGFRSAMAVPA